MWVKICANTCVEDALKAAELGADAVGFVFAPSSRRVTAAEVRAISAAMPVGVERVGVFGVAGAEEIAATAAEARLTAVQLHGGFDQELTRALQARLGAETGIIQVVHWPVGGEAGDGKEVRRQMAAAAETGASRVLVDARVGQALGGTGRSFDWEGARGVLGAAGSLKVIAAGGLRAENVGEAIAVMRPWGVDVASGVEREPGRKDYGKMARFIENARRAWV